MSKRILVIGHAGHGKDTVCEILRREFGLTFESSSMFCAAHVMMPAFASEKGIKYDSAEACFQDRVNHRAFWFDTISAYNTSDRARLTREIFARYDVYCGMRNRDELHAARDIIRLIIWVDASQRIQAENSSSCTVLATDADVILDNNGAPESLREQILAMAWRFK